MPISRRSNCVPLPLVVCLVVACQPILQHRNSYNRTDNYRQWNAVGSPDDGHKDARNMLRYYNRTDNYRQWNAVGSPDDGHKDARNMLRYYRLPINHYLLHLVGFTFTYLSNMHGHLNIKFGICKVLL